MRPSVTDIHRVKPNKFHLRQNQFAPLRPWSQLCWTDSWDMYVGWSEDALWLDYLTILNPESRSILTTAHAHLIQSFGSQVSRWWFLINSFTKGGEVCITKCQFAKRLQVDILLYYLWYDMDVTAVPPLDIMIHPWLWHRCEMLSTLIAQDDVLSPSIVSFSWKKQWLKLQNSHFWNIGPLAMSRIMASWLCSTPQHQDYRHPMDTSPTSPE